MKIKKLLSLLLIISLVLGSSLPFMGSASFAEGQENTYQYEDELEVLPPGFEGKVLTDDELVKLHDLNEELRVIVELNDDSVESYLKQRGNGLQLASKSQINALQKDIEVKQDAVINKIERVGVSVDVKERFSLFINGFSADVQYKDITRILAIPDVKDVYIAETFAIPEPMISEETVGKNPDLIGMENAWALGYKGEGQLISIIDTGIDYNHKDMNITNIDRAKVQENFKYNAKVPYGYNFAENNDNIKDNPIYNYAHGMHVAGIAAANGDLKGVAPEAQLIGQKVFPNNTNKYAQTDALIRAIEDSVLKDADVVNMSLGSRSGFVDPDDPLHRVIQSAINNGVTFAISAGNDAISTYPLPIYSDNPDTGVIGAPGTVKDAITVASFESSKINYYVLEYTSSSGSGKIPYVNSNNGVSPHIALAGGQYELVYCGDGEYSDFPGTDLTGKIALIENTNYSFTWPARYAQEFNAAGVIFYNAPDNEYMDIAVYNDEVDIPVVLVSSTDGFTLRSIINRRGKVSFNGEIQQFDSPYAGTVSDFSSWGPNPDLSFKPNVMAPGGNIWSTVNDDEYTNMSGTSMAAPFVAGASALISQYLEENYPEITGREKTLMIKNRLMSTAYPVIHPEEALEYSPRQQGAGLIKVDKAIMTNAIVTSENGVNGIELGSIGNTKEFTFNVENFGNEPLTFELQASKVITDARGPLPEEFDSPDYDFPLDKEYNQLKPAEVEGAAVLFSENQITVNPGETVQVTATLNIPETTRENIFTDGFIYLNSTVEGQPDLVIPYIGFYGNWDSLNIVDPQAGTDEAYFDFTCLATRFLDLVNYQEVILILGSYEDENGKMRINNDVVSFAPQGRHSVNYRTLIPVVSLLRNAKDLELNILDENMVKLRTIARERLVRKSGWTAKAPYYVTSDAWIWDGLLYNPQAGYMEQAPEGQYYLQVKSRIEGSDTWQELILPFKVDNTGPNVTITSERPQQGQKGYVLTWEVEDNLTDAEFFVIQSNADVLDIVDGSVRSYTLDALETGMATLQVRAYDYAYNYNSAFLNYGEPTTPGEKEPISPYAPGRLEIIPKHSVNFQARYTMPYDENGVQQGYWVSTGFKVINEDGQVVLSRTFDGNNQKNFYIQEDHVISEDGKYEVIYEGLDSFGNYYADSRYIFIDTTAPELILNNVGKENTVTVAEDVNEFTLEGVISDNLTGMFLWINAEPVVEEYFDYIPIDPIPFSYTMPLKEGANILQIQLTDSAGNRVYRTVTINKQVPEFEPIDVTPAFANEYVPGKGYANRIKLNWSTVEEAAGYNIYVGGVLSNDALVTANSYTVDEKEGIDLSRLDGEDKVLDVRVEAVDANNNVIGIGDAAVTIPMLPYIEWIKINGQDVTDNFNITDVDNLVEIQVKFSHELKDTYWNRSTKPTNHIKVQNKSSYKPLPADFSYDKENNIYTLRPWGGLTSGKVYELTISRSLQDIYNGSYLQSDDVRVLNVNNNIDDTPFQVESIKTIDGRDFTNKPIRNVPVNTKIVITFNKLINIETYEEDDYDGKYAGLWLTKNSDGTKGSGNERLINTVYQVIEDNGRYKSVLIVEPKLSTGYSYKNLDEDTTYYVVAEGALKDAYNLSLGTNQIYQFTTVGPNEPMENLPVNAVIVGNEAYDINYLNNNSDAQIKLIEWFNSGNDTYIKLNEDTIVNHRGEIVSLDELPDMIIYYDSEGNTTVYAK